MFRTGINSHPPRGRESRCGANAPPREKVRRRVEPPPVMLRAWQALKMEVQRRGRDMQPAALHMLNAFRHRRSAHPKGRFDSDIAQ